MNRSLQTPDDTVTDSDNSDKEFVELKVVHWHCLGIGILSLTMRLGDTGECRLHACEEHTNHPVLFGSFKLNLRY